MTYQALLEVMVAMMSPSLVDVSHIPDGSAAASHPFAYDSPAIDQTPAKTAARSAVALIARVAEPDPRRHMDSHEASVPLEAAEECGPTAADGPIATAEYLSTKSFRTYGRELVV